MRGLSHGDKLIATVLGGAFAISLLASLYTLESQFLVEVPSNGGTLTEGIVGAPRFVNPLLAVADADRGLTMLTYAGLMGYDASGRLIPVLAESYDVSEDGKTYTFVIRKGAEFSDGTPITADDVVFTVEKAQNPAIKSPELANWANVDAVAIDSRTVRFTLAKAYAPFLTDTTLGIMPARLWRDVSDAEFPFSPLMSEPVGAGPFRIESIARDKEGVVKSYRLKANSRYALGRPYLDSLTFIYFKDADELKDALARGRVESAYGVPSPTAMRIPYSRVFGIFFNQGQNPLYARAEVRKALSAAVNRDALVQNVLGGYAVPLTGPVPPGIGAEIPVATTSENPAEDAKAILSAAGWKFDEDAKMWKLASQKLSLTVALKTANVPELKAIAERAKNDFEAAGVPTEVELYDPSTLATDIIRPRKFDTLLFGMVVGRDRDLFAFWDSSERNDPGLNVAQYANRKVDDLLEKLRGETDPSAIAADLTAVNSLIAADYPAVFLEAPEFLYTLPADMKGVAITHVATPPDRLLGIAGWYRHTEWVWPGFSSE